MTASDLDDVLLKGEGIERPFRCPSHDDHNASASVNVLKGVWYCYACHAKGMVDGKKKAPSLELLQAMLEPEQTARIHPRAYLELFRNDLGVWPSRFAPWIRGIADLGCDPFTGDATFPVHTPNGRFAGVGRRLADADAKPRYVYPSYWAASRSLFIPQLVNASEVLVLVEGAADACAVAEVGCQSAAVYGSGLHLPQWELIRRRRPKLIILGFDSDEAGERGAERARSIIGERVETIGVTWNEFGAKDPAELHIQSRESLLLEAVGRSEYGSNTRNVGERWRESVLLTQRFWRDFIEERYAYERAG